jgi:hypothetical protein
MTRREHGFFQPVGVCRTSAREQIRPTERREARMYVGLGTILLIVLIIILLIWIF